MAPSFTLSATYSLASALFYCGFKNAAYDLAAQSHLFSEMHFDEALSRLRDLMLHLAPEIGLPTVYGKRTKSHSRTLRRLTFDTLFTELTPFPTVVIPVLPNGSSTHAFCVVDDLIFDSTTPKALKLKMESIQWIFNDQHLDIYQAYRFNVKFSPPGMKIDTTYKRAITLHWKHPGRADVNEKNARVQHHTNHLVYIDNNGDVHSTAGTVHKPKKSVLVHEA